MTRDILLRQVDAFFTAKVTEHGPGHRGMDWKSLESQHLRFDQLMRLIEPRHPFSILDYGCGGGALLDYLLARKLTVNYTGFDISDAMITAARQSHANTAESSFTTNESRLAPADYVVASGIFNMKLHTPDAEWRLFMEDTVSRINGLCTKGFAFNVLTSYSDVEKRRADLYYADPLYWFDLCKRQYSPRVALLHDYPAWEFTMLVRKEAT